MRTVDDEDLWALLGVALFTAIVIVWAVLVMR